MGKYDSKNHRTWTQDMWNEVKHLACFCVLDTAGLKLYEKLQDHHIRKILFFVQSKSYYLSRSTKCKPIITLLVSVEYSTITTYLWCGVALSRIHAWALPEFCLQFWIEAPHCNSKRVSSNLEWAQQPVKQYICRASMP